MGRNRSKSIEIDPKGSKIDPKDRKPIKFDRFGSKSMDFDPNGRFSVAPLSNLVGTPLILYINPGATDFQKKPTFFLDAFWTFFPKRIWHQIPQFLCWKSGFFQWGQKRCLCKGKKTKKNRHFSSEHADLVCPSSGETSKKGVFFGGFSLAPAIKCTFWGRKSRFFEVSAARISCRKWKLTFCS